MTGFDFAVIAILLLSVLIGLWRGFLYEILSLLGWPLAFVSSNMYADRMGAVLPIDQDMLRLIVAYALVFTAAMLVWGAIVWGLSKLLKAIGMGMMDRLLGGLFGVLRAVLLVVAVVWLAGMTEIPERPFWKGARMSKTAEDLALLTKQWLPDDIAGRIHYRTRN
jgi:membrane protein required for colicin V production